MFTRGSRAGRLGRRKDGQSAGPEVVTHLSWFQRSVQRSEQLQWEVLLLEVTGWTCPDHTALGNPPAENSPAENRKGKEGRNLAPAEPRMVLAREGATKKYQ